MHAYLIYLLILVPLPKAPPDTVRALEGTWAINANGYTGDLVINLDKFNRIDGSILGDAMCGTYDPNTKQIVIKRMVRQKKEELTVVQEFSGVLSEDDNAKPPRYTLKGTFKSDVGGDWGKPNTHYNWNATIAIMKR